MSVTAGAVVVLMAALRWFAPVELLARDVLLRLVPERTALHTVVVGIDDRSIQLEGAWPWPRTRLASLVRHIADADSRAIGIDLLLNEPREGDFELAQACRTSRCVTAATLDDHSNWILPTRRIAADMDLAHAAFELDDDGVLRRIASTKQDQTTALPALSARLASIGTGSPIAPAVALLPGFRTPPRSMPVVSASAVLRGDPASLALLRNRTVVIGITAVALGDRVMTPRSRRHQTDPGVLVHASAAESLQRGDSLREIPPLASGTFVALLVLMALRVSRAARPRVRIAGEAMVLLLPATSAVILVFAQLFIPVVVLTAATTAVVLTAEVRRGVHLVRRGSVAANTLANELGMPDGTATSEVGERLEVLAQAIVRHRAKELESKRVLVHELKTPLAAMDSLSQLLTDFDLTEPERKRVASLLGNETRKLQEMIAGLLEIERVAIRPDTERVTFSIVDLVSSRVAFLAEGIGRAINVVPKDDTTISGDPALIERVIDNLVGNAAKYSPPGSRIVVSVGCDDDNAVIDVMDRGPGVPVGERARIFGSFERGTSAAGTEGFGLGLALVSEAVRWHNGSVEVSNRDGGGSVFTVRLPATVARAAEAV